MSARKTMQNPNKVLIVSDDDDLNLLLEFLLEEDGFQVAVSTTPELAMQALLSDQPEAIFFDLDFQGGNSLSLLESIQEACPDISTFTVARPELRALAEQSLHTGAQGFLMTPVDYRSVKKLLGGNQTAQAPAGSRSSMYRGSCAPVGN
ncbi:MAG TPA: response regulator [Terriglobia bacterium]|nr:response regulator [Terriglobia bacterium]